MASANVRQFTDSNFQTEVLGSDKPVLVDFWAQWCPPCRALSPVIDSIADELGDKATIGKVNTDENRNLSAQYGISSIPTVMIFKDGKPVKKLVGLRRKEELVSALDEAAQTPA
jgi:thioredoxin 1